MLPIGQTEIELSYVIPVFFNQKDTKVLNDLLIAYSKLDQDLIRRIQFVIVDDCSPIKIEIPSDIHLNYQLLRITTDIRWNQAGARNLGVVKAAGPKIIITDCDHFFPESLLRKILNNKIPYKTLYKFKREDANGKAIQSHCNTFYTSKATFFSTLGYDEEFCGNYGYEDVMFRYFQSAIGNKIKYFTRLKKIVSNTIDREESYHNLVRDTDVNLKLMEAKIPFLKDKNPFKAHSRLFLNFEYQVVKVNQI
ncbi:glycosyltransferase family A protein [Parabacteroides bouchesdurhonensis]|uniref:glycosyltransferase family A protein n=1 Tax=Parabacteroides bouchesdurhonensis TaxID=1936995 RepID=UPI000C82D4FC|nr:glycosyltransferase family A protein [Parabacteroides bouchesdurhonensis]